MIIQLIRKLIAVITFANLELLFFLEIMDILLSQWFKCVKSNYVACKAKKIQLSHFKVAKTFEGFA